MIAAMLVAVLLAGIVAPMFAIGRVEGDDREPIRLRRR